MPALMQGKFPLAGRAPRVSKTLPITVWDIPTESARKSTGAVLDLSDGGLRLVTAKTLYPGQLVTVQLNATGLCFKRCRVIWTRPFRKSQLNEAGLEVLR